MELYLHSSTMPSWCAPGHLSFTSRNRNVSRDNNYGKNCMATRYFPTLVRNASPPLRQVQLYRYHNTESKAVTGSLNIRHTADTGLMYLKQVITPQSQSNLGIVHHAFYFHGWSVWSLCHTGRFITVQSTLSPVLANWNTNCSLLRQLVSCDMKMGMRQ